MIRVQSLHIYPVKSLAGIELSTAALSNCGFEYDRNWMLVDETGKFITQRNLPQLAKIKTEINDHALTLLHENSSFEIELNKQSGTSKTVTIWDDTVAAFDEGEEISKWLTGILSFIDSQIRLVRIDKSNLRNINSKYLKGENPKTAFADSFPYLVTSVDSLNSLNSKLKNGGSKTIPMNRFRPNIVLKGLEPFSENKIEYLSEANGKYKLAMRKPCQRCVITTIDQQTGIIKEPKEPLKSLVENFSIEGKNGAYFGQNTILVSGENIVIASGDELKIDN